MAPLVPLDAAPEGEETLEASAEEDDTDPDEVFVHLGGAPTEQDHGGPDRPEQGQDQDDELETTKPEAAQEAMADYQGDADVAAAEAAEEYEGEIEPVSTPASDDAAAQAVDLPPVMPTEPTHAAPKAYVDQEIAALAARVETLERRR